MVLTEEQMRTLDTEVRQRGMGIDPAVMPAEEADSYAFTPEATVPEVTMPETQNTLSEPVQIGIQGDNIDLIGTDKIETSASAMPVADSLVRFTTKAADNVKKTNIYKRVTYTKEDTLREARDISIETGIPVNAILHSAETMDNARNIYNYRRKQMELMVPGENEVSMDSLMKAYPGLDNIINAGNEVDAAIALQNIKNVRQMTGIVEIAKGNWNIGLLERKMGQTGVKAFREGRAVTEEEFAKYDAIQKQIQEFKETPGFFEDPMMSIVGGTARQIPQQLTGVGTGTLYGGVLAGLAAGATVLAAPATGGASLAAVPAAAKTGFSWGMRAGYAVDMFENSAGQRYIEYSRFKDDNGKRVLTDEEARAYAAVAAAVETGIEFMNAGKILDVLQGNKSAAAKQIREVVAGATDNATFVAGLKRMLSGAAEVAVSESVEEGAQEGADRLISTGVSLYKGTTAIPRYTPGQMLEGALENTLEALPASIGFGLSAAGGGSVGLVQRAARLAEIGNFRYNEEMKNVTGVGMVKTMSENTEVKEFFKKDPDVAKQVLKNTVAGTGYEKVNIDTEMVARQENGLAALRDIGERAGMSVEEIQTAIETGADLTVPTEVYFQMRAENENFAINDDFIAFSDVAPSYARNKYYAEMKKAEIDAIMKDANTRQLEQQMAAIDMIVQDNFAEGIERDAAAAVLTMRPDNPIEGLKEMRGMYKEQLDSILAPVIRELEKGMKQGVDIVRVEGNRDARYERVSNNAEWAREFYKENKRWPTKFELEGMAIDILSGRDFSKLADYQNVPEMQEYYEANAAQIDELLGNIEAFDNIEERIANIDADELQTMEGMSREAYDIYKRESANAIANAPNDAVKRAAKMGAALLAYRADRFAEAKRAAGETNYTAKDYYDRTLQIKYGGTFQQPQKEQYFQVSAEEFNRQKDAVRKQYENTDQWMKAPNGNDTNLTEDQWITVRTEAFKNWFGDWENDPQNASKIVDENGEPKVVYHGTGKKFDTFSKKKTNTPQFWFTDRKDLIESGNIGAYGSGIIMPVYLNIKNPAGWHEEDNFGLDQIKARGFDGKDLTEDGKGIYVAFEPNQIKDATGCNVGFDPQSGNIYLQEAYHGTNARFDKFDMNHGFMGHGTMAHGWGLYFTTSRDLAEDYRNLLINKEFDVKYTGKVAKSKQKLADTIAMEVGWGIQKGLSVDEAIQERIDFHKKNLQFYEEHPKQATKKKIKETQDKLDFLNNIDKNDFKVERQGQVFKVDIPENDTLMIEDKSFDKQPDNVKNILRKVWKDLSVSKPLEDLDGREIYQEIANVTGDQETASKYLNEKGIKGITYDSERNGGNFDFVVFDDNNVTVLEKYYQRQQAMNDTIQGATEFRDNGQRVVTVFDSGNESTIAHELGHVFVADLKDLAEMPNAPEQIKKDWQTIKEWLGYKDSQTKFTTAQQEKFARGFEAYLRTGEAPATGLRKVFQNFKNWLCKIYRDFLSLGGKPSKDVQAVMGRMLATADEVEQAFKLREAESFEKAGGFDYLAKDSLEMYKRWQKDAQEYAKEKVLKEAMKNLTEQRAKELEAVREKMTEDIRTQLLSTPVYRAELVLSANPKLANDWPAEQFGMTYEEYTEAIETQGTLEEATKKAVDVAMQEVEEGLPLEEIKRDAENAVNTSEYRGMYLAFEQEFVQKKMRRDESLSRQIEQTLADIEREASGIGEEVAEDSAEVKRLKQRIKELKYQARWNEAELKALNQLERANNKAERTEAIKAIKKLLNEAKKNVRIYRDGAVAKYKYIREYAKENMAQMSVDDATNVAKWIALEKRAGQESVEALKRALDSELRDTKVNDEKVTDAWQKANDAKFRQRVFAEYAAMATRNKAKVQRRNAILQKRQNTIQKNNNIPANERYMYVHGLYVLGLSKTDAQMPQGEPTIFGMFQEYSDNLQAFFVDEDGNISLPDYILSAFSGNAVYNDGYTNLTMEQYDDFVDVLSAIYKAGIDANKVKSMKDANGNTVLISDVAESIVAEMNARIPAIVRDDITNAGSMTFKEYIQDKARRARISLTKPEEILDWMGPTAHRYIYETVNQSWNKEKVMQEQVAVAVKAIWAPYTNTEKSEMRSKRQFRFGTSILTREEMICVAFNWGTELNRKRIMDGFNVDESTVRELLSNMTQKDWQMVTSVWDLVNSYWPETVRVEESMVGVAPQKQSAMPFEIVGKDGNVYKLNGGYYPIKYDPNKSLAAANQAQEDVAKQMAGGNAAMNRNRGFTKKRTTAKVSRPVMLSFNVLNRHLSDVVHNICFRESLRDVNRIIKNQAVSRAIEDHFGIPQARAFRKWVEDCWAPDVQNKGIASSALEFFRHKQTAAALGYRATTAMLNSLNIFPITDYLGPARTIDALQKFYNSPKENWNFALDRSVFLRERAETMDRDAGEVLRKEFIGGYGKVADTLIRGERAIEAHAFDMLAVTDLALACPLWLSEYQRVYQANNKNLAEMDEDAIARLEMEAVAAGDKAVRKIFGSGEMKDLAPIQKGDEMTKAVSMFYSYFNVVFNALYGGYAQGRREAMTEGATKIGGYSLGFRVAPLVQKLVFWTVFTGVFEGLQRNAIDVLAGGSDDPEEWLKKMFKGVTDNVFGTIPVVRDIASMIVDKLMGERYYGAKPLPAYQLVDTAMRFWNTVESKKKTKIDVFREGMRITNGFTGIGNTLTDAMATTAYWVDTDFDKPLLEYLSAVIFDKRIDKKKKK